MKSVNPADGPSVFSLSPREWDNLVEGLLVADTALAAAVRDFLSGQRDEAELRQASTLAAAIHSLCEEVVQRLLDPGGTGRGMAQSVSR